METQRLCCFIVKKEVIHLTRFKVPILGKDSYITTWTANEP
jgi:hypothetical protein